MDWPKAARVSGDVVAAALVVSGQVSVWTADSGPLAENRAAHAVLLAIATVPLFVRGRRPLPVLLLALGASWLQLELGGEAFQPWFAVVMALYAVGSHGDRRVAAVGAIVTAAVVLAGDIPKLVDGDPVDEVVPAWFVVAGIWGLGRWVSSRRRETADLTTRAAEAERDRARHAAAAVADERARIARELHDLVAHSMGIIVIQAQAAQRAIDGEPEAARTALTSIETSGRQGLGEMRRLLGLLASPDQSSVAPQPGLRDLPELVGRLQAAGMRVDLRMDDDLDGLPAGIDLAAYRIAQEALTNVLRHAGAAARARVAVRSADGAVDVEVCDDGRGAVGVPGGGHGLVGMRERAALYGGSVEAGNGADGGFRVHAHLLVDGTP
jgi:signal transduction histidine kinase